MNHQSYPSCGISRIPANLTTLVEVLRWRAFSQPSDLAFTFLADGEHDEHPLTYGELDRRARAIATQLVGAGATGNRALLVYDSGLDYISALYGCLYAGTIAVPVYPPDPFRMDRTFPRLRSIVGDAGATWLLATEATLDWAKPLFVNVPGMNSSLATDRAQAEDPPKKHAAAPDLAVAPRQPAFLQYTSGSTGVPRGVTITHANLMANLRSIDAALDRENNVVVLWLPAYHDMGLIGGVFQPVYSGRRAVFMSPLSFMQSPLRWLSAISRYRGTITAAPNFAYDLCLRKVTAADRAGLDLSSLIAALNGAEIVRSDTLERFSEAFAECGFRREAFYPSYGLAEATLMVAGSELGAGPVVRSFAAAALEHGSAQPTAGDSQDARALVGCGRAALGQRIVVVDPDTCRPLGERQVGEIWVAGESIGQGYWNRPEESTVTFQATLADANEIDANAAEGSGAGHDPTHFLRTGDLGFIDRGELFVAGRRKELIIIQGRNHYPHDIEETACRSHPLLKNDGGAAFSIEVGGEERLAIVQEVMRPRKADTTALIDEIRSQVAEAHGVAPAAVVLVPAGTLPKTSSGKKQRRACRDQLLAGTLPAIAEWRDERLAEGAAQAAHAVAPQSDTEKALAALWSDVLGVEVLDVHANFFDLGGQSLLAGQLAARIQEAFTVQLSLRTLFANPTIAALAGWLDRPEVRQASGALPPVMRADRSQPLPLSSAQEQLWFLEQLEPEPRYNLTATLRLQGALDVAAFERSLARIVARHEALRTTFEASGAAPRQVVAARQELPLEILPGDRLGSAPATAIDLSTGPLLKAALYRHSDSDHHLAITAHHLICDGWSLAIFIRELSALYAAEATGQPATLEEVIWQYADFAVWQQHCLATPHVARQLDYWKTQLAGVEPLALATDFARSADGGFRGAGVTWTIDKPASEALVELGRQEGATLYMVLLAAFQTLLARYSRQHDVCIGSPVSYRPRREFETAMGYFVQTLALRGDLSGEPTFRQLLGRVREMVLDASANQDAPLRSVVDAVAPRRQAGRSPLFNVMFVFENLPWHPTQSAGLSLGEIEIDHTSVGSYDLALVVEEQSSGLQASLVYNAELFEPGTIEPMATAFQLLLAGMAADPDQPVMRLPMVEGSGKTAERKKKSDDPSPAAVGEFLSASPARIAIVGADSEMSYRELDRRSNQLAHYLQTLGVGPDVPVAIFLNRSPDLIVAMLAVLKAGGAFVPFDPHEATGRLASMLADTQPPAILTSESLARKLPVHDAEVIALDRTRAELDRQPTAAPESRARPDNLAYLVYTSGSTGQPKGVEITRAALSNFVAALADLHELSAHDRVLQLISPAFDVAIEEIFPTLWRGATIVLGPAVGELTGRAILEVCRRQRVTLAEIPPQLFQQCMREWEPADEALFAHLRLLVMGGEAPPTEALNRWLEVARGRVRVIYEFGLTETTVTNLVYELPAGLEAWPARRKMPIGRPIAGSEIYLLDRHQQPVPIGAPGELYLGGPGLARGYRNLPEATREHFVEVRLLQPAHASGSAPATESNAVHGMAEKTVRLCRTGDLARVLPDGNVEFLGRVDEQLKVRGLRIEPGEIERVLSQHPAVGEIAVVAREDSPGIKRLVAYVVPSNSHLPLSEELRAWTRNRLPDSMVPTAFVRLDRLPLNQHHKLDRNALPAPALSDRGGPSYAAPRTPIEVTLAEVWRQVLKVERVGIHDNFFELGGDSILTIQVVAQARQTGLRFVPRQMFERQTIAELAAVEGVEAVVEQGETEGEVPLTPIQQWFLSDDVLDPQHFNQAVLLRVDERHDPDMLRAVLRRLVEQHDSLRLRFARKPHGWRQWYGAAEGAWPLSQFNLSPLPAGERASALTAAAADLQARLDLEHGPVARAAWFDLGQGERRLLLIVHHLVVDAVSWKVLLDDLAALWEAAESDASPTPPAKTTSFKYWAQRLGEYAESFDLQNELPFWSEVADHRPSRLPRDFDEVENLQADAEIFSSASDEAQTADLLERANAPYRTQTNEILLAALGQTLNDWGAAEVIVDLEGHGRVAQFENVDLSRTVGWFTTWHPAIAQPPGLPPGALLRQTKESLRRVPNHGLGFGVLRYLSPSADVRAFMASLPRPEISFNYLGRMDNYLATASLERAEEAIGPLRSLRSPRSHVLEVNAYVLNDRLHVDWTYCRRLHRRETIERLANGFLKRLAALVEHCLSPEAGGFTPSDFPLAGLSNLELDKLSAMLGE
jgi:amino acid adenylation domain-containing protein/non-ribosomal peptide synthase protein (TIGR01720 family)